MRTPVHIPLVFKNISSLAAGDVIARLIGFGVTVYLTRVLGAAAFGDYMVASTIAAYILILANPGADSLAVRTCVQEADAEIAHTNIVLLRSGGGIVAVLALVGASLLMPVTPAQGLLLFLHVALLPGLIVSGNFAYQARNRMGVPAIVRIGQACIYAASAVCFVRNSSDVVWIPVLLGGSLLAAGLIPAAMVFRWGSLRTGPDTIFLKRLLRAALPMMGSTLVIMIFYSIDTVMLGMMRSSEEAGVYAAAYRIILLMTSVAQFIFQGYVPILADMATKDLDRSYSEYLRVITVTGVIVGGVGFILASPLMQMMYGAQYAVAIPAFAVLSGMVVLVHVNVGIASPMQLWKLERRHVLIVSIAAVTNIGCNYFWIPGYGMVGAAYSTLAAEAVVFVLAAAFSGRFVPVPWISGLLQPMIAGAIGAIAALAVHMCGIHAAWLVATIFVAVTAVCMAVMTSRIARAVRLASIAGTSENHV